MAAHLTSNEKPTRIRHLVIGSTSLMAVLLYLDRFCISFVEMYIQEDLGLTDRQVGWMLSAFFWTYALGQVPSGWLTDLFGSRKMLTLYVLAWSLFTGLTGAVSSFAAVLVLRLGFGFGQAGAYPTASSIVSKWIPFSKRGTASGIIALGGRFGGFLALFASGYLLVALTPGDTRTTLNPDEILNGPLLCHELYRSSNSTKPVDELRQRCLEQFSTSSRNIVIHHAEKYADALDNARKQHELAERNPDEAVPELTVIPVSDADIVANELNTIILSPGFFELDDLNGEGISVEKEARRLLNLSGNISDLQSGRVNRLVLEALHRRSIRKLYGNGWRRMMFLYGSLGIFVASLIWWNCRTTPTEHPRCNDAEAALIANSGVLDPGRKSSGVPLRGLVSSGSMWCACITQFFTNIGWVFLLTWAPRYYTSVHLVSVEQRALFVSIPPLLGWAGMLAGGVLTDTAVRYLGLRWGRALPISLSRFVAMGAYIVCLFDPGVTLCVILFSTVAFATALGNPASWAFTQDVGGQHVGSVLGWGNMWGNLGAAIAPPIVIWLVGGADNWNNAFIACGVAFFAAGISALGINAAKPIQSALTD
ncbi:MAG: MFS transporter [Fuerstiella sp.]|nr:MFS transporter [Fuerstiella sp.]